MGRPKSQSISNATAAAGLGQHMLVLDNGAHTIKAGLTQIGDNSTLEDNCRVIPNVIAHSDRDRRTYIGAEYDNCLDFGELKYKRPVEKGYIVNWGGEKVVWERSFFDKNATIKCAPEETNLILTEPPNSPVMLQRNADEMVFEEFGFAGYYRTIAPSLNAYAPTPFAEDADSAPGLPLECLLVVDAGYSHTTITPLYQGRPFQSPIRRLEIGGKTLTNQMKSLISRTFDVSREDHIVGEIKEDVCYVSQSFNQDLEKVWKGGRYDSKDVDPSVVVDYVLPDYEDIKRGYARPHDPKLRHIMLTEGGRREHILTIGNERFVVPELLFTPSDIGMQQDGLCGTILQSLHALPAGLKQTYLANILVTGGTSQLPGFVERLESELRSVVDEDFVVRVATAKDPIKNCWLGGARMAQDEGLMKKVLVSKAEYAEHGDSWLRRRFAGKVGR